MGKEPWECVHHYANMAGRGPWCGDGKDLKQCGSSCPSNKTIKQRREELRDIPARGIDEG